jgi:hypothetical protein
LGIVEHSALAVYCIACAPNIWPDRCPDKWAGNKADEYDPNPWPASQLVDFIELFDGRFAVARFLH